MQGLKKIAWTASNIFAKIAMYVLKSVCPEGSALSIISLGDTEMPQISALSEAGQESHKLKGTEVTEG